LVAGVACRKVGARGAACSIQIEITNASAQKFRVRGRAYPNHFSPIRSFLIDSDLRQARAASFMQIFFAHHLQRTRTNTVAKIVALADGKNDCVAAF
jgi:hypothetical protein